MLLRLPAALAALALLPALALAAAAPASASCAEAESPPESRPIIFSGTAVENRTGYTRFEVDRVWAGPDLADEVWVQGGQDQAWWPLNLVQQVESSVDTDFVVGEEYVVGAGDDFSTNLCSVTEAAGHEPPADARTPVDDGARGADVPLSPLAQTAVAGGVVAALVTGVMLLLRWRRRHPRPA
ncbi:hypothetical protein [Nocardioides daphniae]|uniref:Uncharacterized protein n=1 Tax=Nocardioides daphniae TaxID=402297 RepID=A0A4P7U6W0_9ACTN|nr:hypothetical protein [Nocardioides daphniae]QCC75982.1 hypothetical protein E2C04_00060 [Nocardioides daphniae]GGD11403.1 hypothetical protein GCM10007231_07760 [Nocardioides daphniae]